MLKIEHLNKSFGSTQVLFDVSFNVSDGRILGKILEPGQNNLICKILLFHKKIPPNT